MLCNCVIPYTERVVLCFLSYKVSSSESAKGESVKVRCVVLLVQDCYELSRTFWATSRLRASGPAETPHEPDLHNATPTTTWMASIPNLRTLRTGRRGHGLRGGRSSRGAPHRDDDGDVRSVEAGRDAIIQQTDHDASSTRMSTVSLGYLDDPFAKAFLAPGEQITKRYPTIHRGTYVRTEAIDKLVIRFLDTRPEQNKQIVSLGAGSDTRFFRLTSRKSGSPLSKVTYHELDFEANANQKRTILRQSTELSDCLKEAEQNGSTYHLHAIDLRDLTNKSPPIIPGLDPTLPTLLLSECCLCYLPPDAAASVLQYFTMNLPGSLAFILYEPIRPFDALARLW